MPTTRSFLLILLVLTISAAIPIIISSARVFPVRIPTSSRESRAMGATSASVTEFAQERRDLTALVFEVQPFGFLPRELTIPEGRYLVVVQNRSGIRDLTFRLDRESGERIHEVRQQRLDWKKQVDLTPGTYFLTAVGQREWRAVINVAPR